MALFRTVADRLFKGQVFLPPEEIQTAYGSFVVRPSENRIDRDPHAASESQWISGIPAGGDKGADDVFFRTDQRDVERIAGNSAGGMGEGGATAQIGMLALMTFPEPRGEEISPEKIDDRQRENETQPVDVSHDFVFRRSAGETEEMTTLHERTSTPSSRPSLSGTFVFLTNDCTGRQRNTGI